MTQHTNDEPSAATILTAQIQTVPTEVCPTEAVTMSEKKVKAIEATETTETTDATSRFAHPASSPPSRSSAPLRWLKKLDYVPKNCRYDPESPPPFTWGLCFLFGLAGLITVSNLYYNHPILNVLANDFHVSYETASQVPTFMQAGYAVGLTFICPLADIFRRRPFILTLVFFTGTVWIGLCLTKSFTVFRILSFFCAMTTVTPQVMLPLVAELAPPKRRAMMLSVAFAGLFTGMLFARILSGIATQFTSWRTIYFVALGLQYGLVVVLFFFLPDYPSTNPDGISYLRIIWSLLQIAIRHPLLIQTGLICFFISASFVGFWTTLTFQLASKPFYLSTIDIGLFALIGMPPFFINPHLAHYLLKRFHAIYASVVGLALALVGIVIGTCIGTFTLAGPVIMGISIDLGFILTQTACRTQIVPIKPEARNRVNTIFAVMGFFGMLMGTAVCNRLYAMGGWRYSGYAEIGFVVVALGLCFVRGPHETRWFGFRGGWRMKSSLDTDEEVEEAVTAPVGVPAVALEDSSGGDEKRPVSTAAPSDLEKGVVGSSVSGGNTKEE